jgi:hypothetical protein
MKIKAADITILIGIVSAVIFASGCGPGASSPGVACRVSDEVADPSKPGPLSFSASGDITVKDESRKRTFDVAFYHPVEQGGSAISDKCRRYPVVIFSPGFAQDKSAYYLYGEHLASWGYIVLFRNHPDYEHKKLALDISFLIGWLGTVDADPTSPYHGRLDLGRIATSGHSLGGKISLLSAAYDRRIRVSAPIDPSNNLDPSVAPELMPLIRIPMLLIGGEMSGKCVEDNYTLFFENARSTAMELTLVGADHTDFQDPDNCFACAACPQGTRETSVVQSLAKKYVTAWLNHYLLGISGYRSYLYGEGARADESAGLVRIRTR